MSDIEQQSMNGANQHEMFMREAIIEAERAAAQGEVPVGCVLVSEGAIIARGHNLRELNQDPTAHAELIAIRKAAEALGSWRLIDTTLYVTLEPCPMCAGAIINARISEVIYGCRDPKAGALDSLYRLGDDSRLNHRFAVQHGLLKDECAGLLSDFFRTIREKQKLSTPGA